MMHYPHSQMELLTAICMLGIACTEAPTTPEGLAPNFDHKPGHKLRRGKQESTPLVIEFRDADGDKVVSDGRFGNSYSHDECGVRADFPPSGSGDATFDADASPVKGNERKTCGDPRFITLRLDDPVDAGMPRTILSEGAFMNVDGVEFVTGPELKMTVFHTSFCSLYFNPNRGPGSNLVWVTKVAEGNWTVETQAPPNNVAFCADGERGYRMTFAITVTLK